MIAFDTAPDSRVGAIVKGVVGDGKHGPYAVAISEDFSMSITFSLNRAVWCEQGWPESGTIVVLSKLRKKKKGWRALKARYVKPEDFKPPTKHC